MGSLPHRHHGDPLHDDCDGFPVSGAVVRPALSGALSFMEMTRGEGVSPRELSAWIRHRLVEPGIMPMPATIHEKGIGSVSTSAEPTDAWSAPIAARQARIVAAARTRVATTLHDLVAQPPDDRFLAAAIFAARVRRTTTSRGSEWVPSPGVDDRLSDIVLALFAADVLGHREDYERGLHVCEVCGRMCFDPAAAMDACCKPPR